MRYIPENQFTQQELQFLKSIFSIVLNGGNEDSILAKYTAKELFSKCNPDDPETLKFFKKLNACRSAIRKQKKNLSKLANIQGKIKRKLSA